MPAVFKKIKDDNGNEHEVHAFECSVCYKETYTPKDTYLKMKEVFPKISKNLDNKNYCITCAIELEKRGVSIFNEEEVQELKDVYNNPKYSSNIVGLIYSKI